MSPPLTDNPVALGAGLPADPGTPTMANPVHTLGPRDARDPRDPEHPQHADYEKIRAAVAGAGRWNEDQVANISARLLGAYAAEGLDRRLDRAVVGTPLANGDVNVFALYEPWGDRGANFRQSVNATEAAAIPAKQSFEQAERAQQQQAQALAQQQAQPEPQKRQDEAAREAPRLSLG